MGALEALCASAFETLATETIKKDSPWTRFQDANIDLGEYFEGGTVLNDELGNLYQNPSEFERRGGYDWYYYIGEDPRLNDYFPTTEESFEGAIAIKGFNDEQAEKEFLAPPGGSKFNAGSCD